jgi:predicted SnoaL-like aldol condensation-catalyzing enzyme
MRNLIHLKKIGIIGVNFVLVLCIIGFIHTNTSFGKSVAEKNKELVTRFIDEAYNYRNMETVDELVDSNYVEHTNGVTAKSSDIIKQTVAWLGDEAPDFKLVVDDIIAENDLVTVRWIYSGFNEKFEKQIIIHGVYICRCEDGKIVGGWQIFDNLSRHQQLGYTLTPPVKKPEK